MPNAASTIAVTLDNDTLTPLLQLLRYAKNQAAEMRNEQPGKQPAEGASMRFAPIVAIEVDGLLSVPVTRPAGNPPDEVIEMELVFHRRAFPRETQPKPAWALDGTSTSRYWFSRIGLTWVDRLLARGIDVVWASSWLEYANVYFAPNLGFPRLPLAVTQDDWTALATGNVTPRELARPFDGRPLLVVADAPPPQARRHLDAVRRPADRALTRLHFLPWTASITEADITAMNRWLHLAATPEGHKQLRHQHRREMNHTRRTRRPGSNDPQASSSTGTAPAQPTHTAEPAANFGDTTLPRLTAKARFEARRIGDASRVAQRLLEDIDAAGGSRGDNLTPHDAARLVAALRGLVDAITAEPPRQDRTGLTTLEEAFAIGAGVPASVFTEQGRRDAHDRVVWSALRDHTRRGALDALLDHAIADIVPGLRDAIDAFPASYTDLDRFTALTTADETLDGLSPLQWLLLGRNPTAVATSIDDLGRMP